MERMFTVAAFITTRFDDPSGMQGPLQHKCKELRYRFLLLAKE